MDLCRAYLRAGAGDADGRRPPRKDGPVVTISRAAGARGNSVAEEIVRRLDAHRSIPKHRPWTLFNQNLLQHVIDEHCLPEGTVDYFPEDKHGEVRIIIGEILGLHSGTYTTMRKMAETIRRIAVAGNSVIVGRGANFITRDIGHSVHVRLVGSEEHRSRHFARISGLSQHKAEEEVVRLDRGRKRYIKKVFKEDIDDPLHYDLVLNTDRFTDIQAADLIITALERKIG